jgi:hypothetical protein
VGPGGQTFTSPDARIWTLRNYVTTSSFGDIVFFNNQFIAVGSEGGLVTSPTGDQWQARDAGTRNALNRLAIGKGRLVAVGGVHGGSTDYATIATSTNGLDWVSQDLQTNGFFNSVTYGHGQFVAVGNGMNGRYWGTILTSSNGLDWTAQKSGLTNQWFSGPSEFKLTEVGFGQGIFRIGGYGYFMGRPGNYVTFELTSPDGVHWTGGQSTNSFIRLIYANHQWMETRGTSILSSMDGKTWTTRATVPGHTLYGLTYDHGQFVAVGDGAIVSSPDGLDWTVRQGSGGFGLRGVAYGQGRFVAVGNGGVILQSGLLQLKLEPNLQISNGILHGWVSNLPGPNCTIEASANLTDWLALTNITTTNAWTPFTDPEATNFRSRFYRAKALQP